MAKKVKTRGGHVYYSSRMNFPVDFDDGMKDEVLDRLAHAFDKLHGLAKQGVAMSRGETGTVMVSLIGLLSPNMEAAYVQKSRMNGPMAAIAPLIDEGDYDVSTQLHVSLFYDHRLSQPFHPNSDVGMFLLEKAK